MGGNSEERYAASTVTTSSKKRAMVESIVVNHPARNIFSPTSKRKARIDGRNNQGTIIFAGEEKHGTVSAYLGKQDTGTILVDAGKQGAMSADMGKHDTISVGLGVRNTMSVNSESSTYPEKYMTAYRSAYSGTTRSNRSNMSANVDDNYFFMPDDVGIYDGNNGSPISEINTSSPISSTQTQPSQAYHRSTESSSGGMVTQNASSDNGQTREQVKTGGTSSHVDKQQRDKLSTNSNKPITPNSSRIGRSTFDPFERNARLVGRNAGPVSGNSGPAGQNNAFVNQVVARKSSLDRRRTSTSSSVGRNASPPAASRKTTTAMTATPMRGPPGVICYICGRNYGTTSITIHQKKCLEKWKMENDALPKHLRRPVPVAPDMGVFKSANDAAAAGNVGFSGSPGGKYKALDDFNDAAFQSFQGQYVKCKKCGRTFMPDRLQVHEKHCNGVTFKRKYTARK